MNWIDLKYAKNKYVCHFQQDILVQNETDKPHISILNANVQQQQNYPLEFT
jgi:hypothetical protein